MYQSKHNFVQESCQIKIEGNYIDLLTSSYSKEKIDAEQKKEKEIE